MLKLLPRLHGLEDSGKCWHTTLPKHFTHDLGVEAVSSDIFLFFRRAREQVTRLLTSYVDKALACDDGPFAELTKENFEGFEVKSREQNKMRFSEVYINERSDGLEIHRWA